MSDIHIATDAKASPSRKLARCPPGLSVQHTKSERRTEHILMPISYHKALRDDV